MTYVHVLYLYWLTTCMDPNFHVGVRVKFVSQDFLTIPKKKIIIIAISSGCQIVYSEPVLLSRGGEL